MTTTPRGLNDMDKLRILLDEDDIKHGAEPAGSENTGR